MRRAPLNRPRLLLLDEPTAELDVESVAGVLRLVGRAGAEGAMLLALTHDARLLTLLGHARELRDGVLGPLVPTGHEVT